MATEDQQTVLELRRALDELLDLAEEAGEKVCVVEDAHGLEYPASEGELPVAKLKKRKKRQSAQVEDALVLVRDDDEGEVDVAEVLRDLNE